MKSSEILRKAARLWERRSENYLGLCGTVKDLCGCFDYSLDGDVPAAYRQANKAMEYVKRFAPQNATCDNYWFESRGQRILAACFAAAVAESEGD